MDAIGMEFSGFDQLQKKFEELSNLDKKKFFVEEFKSMGDLLVRAMRAQTPVYQGNYRKSRQYASRNHARGTLRDSIGKKVGGKDIPVVWVSLNRKANRDAWYQHMVVGGHSFGNVSVRENPIVKKTWDAVGGIVEGQLRMKLANKIKAMVK